MRSQQERPCRTRKKYVGKRAKKASGLRWIERLICIGMAVFVFANCAIYARIIFAKEDVEAPENGDQVSEKAVTTPEETTPKPIAETAEVVMEPRMSAAVLDEETEVIPEIAEEKEEELTYLQATLVLTQANPESEEDGDTVPPQGDDFAQADETNMEVWSEEPQNANVEQESEPYSWTGTFTVTAYCSCQQCCPGFGRTTATGTIPTEGRTIAVDPKVIPYGSTVILNGHEYIAEDCGGAIKSNRLDVYFASHQAALNFGIGKYECTVIPAASK